MLFRSTTQHYLFRGNFPGDSHSFSYDLLMEYVRSRAQGEAGITLPEKLRLVDISLLQDLINRSELKIERDFFEKNAHVGRFVHWTVIGHPVNASSLSEGVRKKMALYTPDWDLEDKLVDRIDKLHSWVHTLSADNVPTVYYVHCSAGVDRTGEVSGSYYMRHLKWTWMKALQYDYQVGPRPINKWNQNAMNWYCWWMYYNGNGPVDCGLGLN